MVLLDFFKTGADKPVLADRDEVDRLYRRKRRSVFFALVFGYSFFPAPLLPALDPHRLATVAAQIGGE